MIVYKATNTVNGKAYIGITKQALQARMAQHKWAAVTAGSRTAFAAAIRKYGFVAFTWDVIFECATREELEVAEVRLIDEHNTLASGKCGYNRTNGGAGSGGYTPTDETRARLSAAVRAVTFRKYGLKRQMRLFHNRTGIPHTEATLKKISDGNRRRPIEQRAFKVHPNELPAILARREAGDSFRTIGEAYGVRAETIFYFCRRHREAA